MRDMNEKNKIKNIILDYCEGDTDTAGYTDWLEFPRDDLPEMVEKIKEAVLPERKTGCRRSAGSVSTQPSHLDSEP